MNEAFDCFIEEDFPFYKMGCELKYEINWETVTDKGYFISKCMSGEVVYQYEQDQERYAIRQYNKKLEKFEESLNEPEFIGLKGLNDYCKRRFSDVEEVTNCRVMTNSVRKDFFYTDFCTHRLFSANDDYFAFNLVYKWACLRFRLGS